MIHMLLGNFSGKKIALCEAKMEPGRVLALSIKNQPIPLNS